ncbi:helix-turn-helix domain-containing protein [Clostridium sp. BJN0013]|uniref:helix-turn-helix domain-containing protein n=1 Tax=Clostridium sp. BJN0013 TaxID=3236840 RepID=UPI0034C67CFB
MENNILGNRIRILREEKSISQLELAKILNIANTTLSQYESGKRIPSDSIKKKIADYFNVSIDYLLGRTDVKNSYDSADKITESLNDDPELAQFWDSLKDREDLKLLFKQTRAMPPNDIKKIIRIIKAIEDEEDRNDG